MSHAGGTRGEKGVATLIAATPRWLSDTSYFIVHSVTRRISEHVRSKWEEIAMMLMICLTGDQDHRIVSIVTGAQESVVEMGISNKTFRDIPCYLGSFERVLWFHYARFGLGYICDIRVGDIWSLSQG